MDIYSKRRLNLEERLQSLLKILKDNKELIRSLQKLEAELLMSRYKFLLEAGFSRDEAIKILTQVAPLA